MVEAFGVHGFFAADCAGYGLDCCSQMFLEDARVDEAGGHCFLHGAGVEIEELGVPGWCSSARDHGDGFSFVEILLPV